MFWIRWAFAALSWFLASGLMTLGFRTDSVEHASAFLMMAAAFAANGFLVKPRP